MNRVCVGLLWLAVFVEMGCTAQAVLGGASSAPSASSGGSERGSDAGAARVSGAGDATIITLPDTNGMSRAEAEVTLRRAGLSGQITLEQDPAQDEHVVDRVCKQVPGGGQATRAHLAVILGFCPANTPYVEKRPELAGLSVEAATARVRAAGFTGRIEVGEAPTSQACKIGLVCYAYPERWELDQDRSMTLYVGRDVSITVPD